MTRALMIVPTSAKVNISKAANDIVKMLQEESIAVKSFLPIDHEVSEQSIAIKNVIDFLDKGDMQTLLYEIVARYRHYAENSNVVVVPGLGFSLECPYFSQLNIAIAKALDARIIMATQEEYIKNPYLQKQISIMSRPYNDRLLGNFIEGENHNDLLSGIKQYADTNGTKFQRRLPPPFFCFNLIQRATKANKRIVLPEGNDLRTIQAAIICSQRNLARCVLIGNKQEIHTIAQENNLELNDAIEIIEPVPEVIERYIEPMVEIRKHKGMTPEVASVQLKDSVVLGTMMLQQGDVDGLVSGAVHTTADTVRPALQLIKTLPETKLVSSVFFMCLPEQVLVFGDCAINPNPNAEELADIAIQSAASAEKFGIDPRVAMISYSTGNSAFGPDVDKVRAATQIIKTRRSDIKVDGPLQYDAAIVPEVGKRKAPDSEVAGRANVFIFPDLNTGNSVSKSVQRAANIVSIGPMLQGLRKPVNDLSRGSSAEDIVFTIALTAVQAI